MQAHMVHRKFCHAYNICLIDADARLIRKFNIHDDPVKGLTITAPGCTERTEVCALRCIKAPVCTHNFAYQAITDNIFSCQIHKTDVIYAIENISNNFQSGWSSAGKVHLGYIASDHHLGTKT